MFSLSKEEEERALTIHRKSIVVDTHNDAIRDLMTVGPFVSKDAEPLAHHKRPRLKGLGIRGEHGQMSLDRIEEGGINCLFFGMYVSPLYRGRLKRLLQMLDVFYLELEKNSNRIALATTYKEVIDTVKMGKIATIISVEGGEPLEGDIGVLRILYKLGIRSMTLTHFPRNELADGSGEDSGSHITEFGVAVVEEMNKLGMIVDISHINEVGFWDVLEKTRAPVLASHSASKELCDHHRNLTDEQIEALVNNGGVMNLPYCAPFLKQGMKFVPEDIKKVTLDDWLNHLDHVINLVGPDHVGLGSDFPICAFLMMDDVTKVPNITRGLVARNYSDEDIEKILGGNNLRVFKKVLK